MRTGVVKTGQGVLVEQKAQCGLVVLIGDIGIKAEALIIGAHHVKHEISVIAQYSGEQIKRLALSIRARCGAVATVAVKHGVKRGSAVMALSTGDAPRLELEQWHYWWRRWQPPELHFDLRDGAGGSSFFDLSLFC